MSGTTIETTLTRDGVRYHGEYATIEHTMLGFEDHGMMTAQLGLAGHGWGQAAGGYRLDEPAPGGGTVGTAFGMDQVMQVLRVAGVSSWESLKGSQVLVLRLDDTGGPILGLASTDGTRVLVFAEHAGAWADRP